MGLGRVGCALAALGLAAGCTGGGGGSGSGSTSRHGPGFFETGEYFANAGLDVLGASSAYAAGGTGDGILVGVIDTGIDVDHPEFAGVIDSDSTDIVTGNALFLDDEDGHGTAVAGVIAARRKPCPGARGRVRRRSPGGPRGCVGLVRDGLRVRSGGCGGGDRLCRRSRGARAQL
jgi:subtilisin family serine protease